MLPIRHKELPLLAKQHYRAINAYLQNRSKKSKREQIERAIATHFPSKTLESILLATPEELKTLAVKNDAAKTDFSYFRTTLYENLNDKVYEIVSPEGTKTFYNARTLIDWLGITVCPYCNRNFIYNAGSRRSSELDHFYSESEYPWLAVSFYNLIPSCKVCNQQKLTKTLPVNPYQTKAFTDWKFRLKIRSANFYYDTKSFKIYGDAGNKLENELMREHISTLYLNKQYEKHKDYILEVIQKHVAYNDDYIDSLFRQFEGSLFKNREDVLRFVYANFITEEEIGNRPLAKLTKDITGQLGLDE